MDKQITMAMVLIAYDYASDHPHKYLKGTTNWCEAVAFSLREQMTASEPKPVECLACNGIGMLSTSIGSRICSPCEGSGKTRPAPAGVVRFPRDPSREMLDAARDWSIKKYGQGVGIDGATGCWHAMYDAEIAKLNGAPK